MRLMRKRKWLAAALAALLLSAATWFLWPTSHTVTAEVYEQLHPGMARAEVEGLLGCRGGTRQDFSRWLNNRSPTVGAGSDLLNGQRNQPGIEYWYQDSGVIIVRFDADDRVADRQFLQVRESTASQVVRRWLGRFGW
jgi:hypothetical protein